MADPSDRIGESPASESPRWPGEAFTPAESGRPPSRPWGAWATILWTLGCLVLLVVVQTIVAIFYVGLQMPATADFASDGNLIGLSTLAAAPAVVGAVLLLIWIRRCSPRKYLALFWPTARQAILSVLGLVLLLAASDAATYLLDRPIVPSFVIEAYESAWLPLLLSALLFAAPISEEVLFRGFLFKGIVAAWGPTAAILLSAVLWGLMHLQYDALVIGMIVASGIYLGAVRYWTESVPLVIVLHGIMNGIATIQAAFVGGG